MLETLLATGSLDSLVPTNRWNVLTQIIQDVFAKCLAADGNPLPELVHCLSRAIVILMTGLRACALEAASGSSGQFRQAILLDFTGFLVHV